MDEENTNQPQKRPEDPSKGEVIAVGSVFAGIIGLFGLIVWASIKDERRMLEESKRRDEERLQRLEEKKQWLNSEYADGNVIYELKDGSYLVVPRVSEQRRVIK